MTERLFRSSSLYRSKGKSRRYLEHTLNKAAKDCTRLIGHIEFTQEEKKAYAQKKELEELKESLRVNSYSQDSPRSRYNSHKEDSNRRRYNSYRGNNK